MSDSKHTPGPWVAKDGIVYTAAETGVIVHEPPGSPHHPTLAKDSCLIAAAPDLLEACEEGLRMCEQIRRVYDGPGLYYVARMEEDFRAAIDKARGE